MQRVDRCIYTCWGRWGGHRHLGRLLNGLVYHSIAHAVEVFCTLYYYVLTYNDVYSSLPLCQTQLVVLHVPKSKASSPVKTTFWHSKEALPYFDGGLELG